MYPGSSRRIFIHCLLLLEKLSSFDHLVLIYFFCPKGSINIGTRDFAVGAPTLWNMLPLSVKSVDNIAKFHRQFIDNLAWPP